MSIRLLSLLAQPVGFIPFFNQFFPRFICLLPIFPEASFNHIYKEGQNTPPRHLLFNRNLLTCICLCENLLILLHIGLIHLFRSYFYLDRFYF